MAEDDAILAGILRRLMQDLETHYFLDDNDGPLHRFWFNEAAALLSDTEQGGCVT